MAMRWYVVHAFSQYEKKVAVALKERIERNSMQDYFGEIIVPTEEVVEMKGGQKRKSERKFFPGYVLVQMDLWKVRHIHKFQIYLVCNLPSCFEP